MEYILMHDAHTNNPNSVDLTTHEGIAFYILSKIQYLNHFSQFKPIWITKIYAKVNW